MMLPMSLFVALIAFYFAVRPAFNIQKLRDEAWATILKQQGRTLILRQEVWNDFKENF
jgi:hypothetical protein